MSGGSRIVAALVASCLIASPALAEPGQSAKDKQVANELVKKAIARSQAGDHSAAIDIYLQAYTIVPNSLLLANIGSEFEKSGKPEEALHYFCLYLENDPNGTNAVYATSHAKLLQGMLGNKHVTDENMCDPPKPRRRHAAPDDGADAADDAPEASAKPAPEAKPAPAPPPAPRGDGTLRNVGIGVGAAGVVLVGVGVYAGVKAKNISDQISGQDPTKPWPANIRALQRSGQSYDYLQIGSLIGGAAALGVGLYLIVHSAGGGETDKDRTVRLAPTTNGVALFGTF